MRMGMATLPSAPSLGLKRLILPLSYWRAAEFAYVARMLNVPQRSRVLDLGSPKDLALLFAREREYSVTAVDILEDAVEVCKQFAAAQKIDGEGPGRVFAEVQDGRALSYEDNTFDAVFSVSVIEHIPNADDTTAMQELIRVVKPGGLVVITVPYDTVYRETFLDGPVYERDDPGKNFFERHYDAETLAARLITPVAAEVVDQQLWGEKWGVEHTLSRIGPLRTALSPLEVVLASTTLRPISSDSALHPKAAFFTMKKV